MKIYWLRFPSTISDVSAAFSLEIIASTASEEDQMKGTIILNEITDFSGFEHKHLGSTHLHKLYNVGLLVFRLGVRG